MKRGLKLSALAAGLIGLWVWLSGCETDGSSSSVHGSFYYGVGFYDPWYWGDYYYPPDVIVTPPPARPDAPPRPAHPIAPTPPPSVRPTPTPMPMPAIPAAPRPMPRASPRR